MKVLFDANVILSALIIEKMSVPRQAMGRCEHLGIKPYLSWVALQEVQRHLAGKFGFSKADTGRHVNKLKEQFTILEHYPPLPWRLPDELDAHLFDAAIFIEADLIVTGDKALWGFRAKGLKAQVISPRDFLAVENP